MVAKEFKYFPKELKTTLATISQHKPTYWATCMVLTSSVAQQLFPYSFHTTTIAAEMIRLFLSLCRYYPRGGAGSEVDNKIARNVSFVHCSTNTNRNLRIREGSRFFIWRNFASVDKCFPVSVDKMFSNWIYWLLFVLFSPWKDSFNLESSWLNSPIKFPLSS